MADSKQTRRPRLVGMNHVAIEVGDVEAALAFYGRIFDFTLRGQRARARPSSTWATSSSRSMEVPKPLTGGSRHFGVVVDDRSAVRDLAKAAGAEMVPGPFLDFLDPWGNRVEVIAYADIQFTKAPHVLRGMGLDLEKTAKARQELADKGMAPD